VTISFTNNILHHAVNMTSNTF